MIWNKLEVRTFIIYHHLWLITYDNIGTKRWQSRILNYGLKIYEVALKLSQNVRMQMTVGVFLGNLGRSLVTDWQKTENVHICTVIFYYSRSWYNLFLFEERNIANIWTFTRITIIQNGFSIWGSNDKKWWIRSLVCTFFQYKSPSYCPYISAYLQ